MMGRAPCCEKIGLKRGPWSPEEDRILISYIQHHGHPNWRALPKQAGLLRCGKSCRLRWMNYLRPDIKRGNFTKEEEETIIQCHQIIGNRWSAIAARLPGRTDNEIKNIWHTNLKKRLKQDDDEYNSKTQLQLTTQPAERVLHRGLQSSQRSSSNDLSSITDTDSSFHTVDKSSQVDDDHIAAAAMKLDESMSPILHDHSMIEQRLIGSADHDIAVTSIFSEEATSSDQSAHDYDHERDYCYEYHYPHHNFNINGSSSDDQAGGIHFWYNVFISSCGSTEAGCSSPSAS
ncbi:hypothetical protein Dimus_028643 [Dionaea muscipula]